MLETLTNGFSRAVKRLRGKARLDEANIQEALEDMRAALLEADVALSVADDFLRRVKADAIGREVADSLNPARAFVGVAHRHLTFLMGDANTPLRISRPPSVLLGCGLQGTGKTTTLAKIAKHLRTKHKKRVLLASVDVRRKAAIEQLRILAAAAEVPHYDGDEDDALARAEGALRQARRELTDVLLIDSAGRTALDEEMMGEIRRLSAELRPAETLYFLDAMQGQDAVNTAKAFHDAVGITGLALTKFDGDSRGGAVLTAKMVTGQPVKFVGDGEKLDDLSPFHPDRFASRVLGMGDIASLAEQAQEKINPALLRRAAKRGKRGGFDLADQLGQIQQMKSMGGIANVLDKLPGNFAEKAAALGGGDGKELKRAEAIILSMTPTERRHPEIIKASRKRRIAAGAATTAAHVNQLLQQHETAKKLMQRHAKNPAAMMRMARQMFGG